MPADRTNTRDRAEGASAGEFTRASTRAPGAAELIRSAVTTYAVTGEPPLEAGGLQRAVAVICPPAGPEDANPIKGEPGTVAGVTALESADIGPVPLGVRAATWNR